MRNPRSRRYRVNDTVRVVNDLCVLYGDIDPAPVIPAGTHGTVTHVRPPTDLYPYSVDFTGLCTVAVREADLRKAV